MTELAIDHGVLFHRDFSITVGTAKLDAREDLPVAASSLLSGLKQTKPMLRATFSIEKTGGSEPNKAKVVIYNLNEKNRKMLQTLQSPKSIAAMQALKIIQPFPVTISAGYINKTEQLFSGEIIPDGVTITKDSVDWVTEINAADGLVYYTTARLNKTYGPGTTLGVLLVDLAKAIGCGLGQSVTKFLYAGERRDKKHEVFKNGVTVTGLVSATLDNYTKRAGLEWGIHDGKLQVLEPGETLLESIVVLKPGTGLIGSPEAGKDGTVKFRCLLNGQVRPGRRVMFNSAQLGGCYKIEKSTYTGDTIGDDWETSGEARSSSKIAPPKNPAMLKKEKAQKEAEEKAAKEAAGVARA